jgi:hypothetical protein
MPGVVRKPRNTSIWATAGIARGTGVNGGRWEARLLPLGLFFTYRSRYRAFARRI